MSRYVFTIITTICLLALPAHSNTYATNKNMKADLTYAKASTEDVLVFAGGLIFGLSIGLPFTLIHLGNGTLDMSLDRTKNKTKSVKLGASIQFLDKKEWPIEFTETPGNWENPQPISDDTILLKFETKRKKRCTVEGLFLAQPTDSSRYKLIFLDSSYYESGTTHRQGYYEWGRYEYSYMTGQVVGKLELVDENHLKIHFDKSFIVDKGTFPCALKIEPSELSFSK